MRSIPIAIEFFESHFPQLSASEKVLFVGLSYFAHKTEGVVDFQISQNSLEEFVNLSGATVANARKGLLQRNLAGSDHVCVDDCLHSLRRALLIAFLISDFFRPTFLKEIIIMLLTLFAGGHEAVDARDDQEFHFI